MLLINAHAYVSSKDLMLSLSIYLHLYIVYAMSASLMRLVACTSSTVLPAKSDSYVILCLHSYQGLILDRSLVSCVLILSIDSR